EDVSRRFASEGFIALAPDLYHGKTTTSPDSAGRLLMELDAERAAKEIAAAGAYLLSRPECTSKKYGVVGFCMGGALAQLAATRDEKVGAAVSFYGGFKKVQIDWSQLAGPILLIYGELDSSVPPSQAQPLVESIRKLGKEAESIVYPGANHAFFNDARPEVHNGSASADAWGRTLAHLRENLVMGR
ncbi:MAG: dienelactone hydrolase family protein, partial [Thermoanaerobaculia bacterium]